MSQDSVFEFMSIYKKIFGEEIELDEAKIKAEKLLNVIRLLNKK